MAVIKKSIGELIQIVDERNTSGRINNFCGINIGKEFMPTVANTDGIDSSKYKIVRKNRFVFSGMQTGRDQCIRIGLYTENDPIIVSPAYTTFEIIRHDLALDEYFFMKFLSNEMDRYGWFLSDSSVRSNLDWDRFCEIEIELPPVPVQQKYVDVYNSMLRNQQAYEKGLDNLKLICDAYIENLRHEIPAVAIGDYIEQVVEQNAKLKFGKDDVKGMTITKEIIPTKANVNETSFDRFIIVEPKQFVYNPRTHGKRIGLGYNNSDKPFIITWNNIAFDIKEKNMLLPEYLFMFFKRDEWDRWACFNSWGSSTEVFAWEDLCETKIPIPDIKIQQSIINIFDSYNKRREIVDSLKTQIKSICPVLIKGSLEEAENE